MYTINNLSRTEKVELIKDGISVVKEDLIELKDTLKFRGTCPSNNVPKIGKETSKCLNAINFLINDL